MIRYLPLNHIVKMNFTGFKSHDFHKVCGDYFHPVRLRGYFNVTSHLMKMGLTHYGYEWKFRRFVSLFLDHLWWGRVDITWDVTMMLIAVADGVV